MLMSDSIATPARVPYINEDEGAEDALRENEERR
jgi:hypothetical protein